MKVRMKVEMSGTRNGEPWPKPGGEIDLPNKEAAKLCANGLAEPVAERAKAEKAVAPAAEERAAPKPSGLTTKKAPTRGRGRPRGSTSKK